MIRYTESAAPTHKSHLSIQTVLPQRARWPVGRVSGIFSLVMHAHNQPTTPLQCYTGALPALDTLRDYDAVFITGSHYSVYERRAWISQLKAYLRLAILGRRVPVKFIGICFGCQVLADALGGQVGPNPDAGFVCKGAHGRGRVCVGGCCGIVYAHGVCIVHTV